MGFFKYRRRIRLFHGCWINLSKKGASISAGIKGVTFNSRGRATLSIPGTGASYILMSKRKQHQELPQNTEPTKRGGCGWAALLFLGVVILFGLMSPSIKTPAVTSTPTPPASVTPEVPTPQPSPTVASTWTAKESREDFNTPTPYLFIDITKNGHTRG